MTIKCGGGTSAAKPGFDQVVVGAGLITAGLGAIAPWLLPVGVLLDAFVFDVASECPGDPPPMPASADLSLTNVIPGGILNPGFNTWRTAVQNLLLNWAWEQYCQCTSGALAPAAYPVAPITSTAPAPTGVASCLSGHWSGSVTTRNTTGFEGDWTSLMGAFPNLAGLTITTRGAAFTAIPMPTGALSVSWEIVGTSDANPFFAPRPINTAVVNFYDATGANIGEIDFLASAVHATFPSYSGTRNVTAGAKYFYVSAVNGATGSPVPSYLDANVSFNCSQGAPSSQPCCPPDPAVLTLLQQLYQLVSSLYQGAPHQLNSYASGVVHSGLSGNGTITLAASVLGVRVDITTDPSTIGVDLGSPDFLFDRGFIVPVVNAAPIRGESRLVYNPQMFLLPALTEQIGYSLHPGVVIKITELVRGP